MLTMDGTGGTYMLRDKSHSTVAVFKPLDEEAFAPFNPRGYTGRLGKPGFRQGVLSGESCYREVVAYLLDAGFSGVPETALVEAQHSSFNYSTTGRSVA
jgi:hypothetical protein